MPLSDFEKKLIMVENKLDEVCRSMATFHVENKEQHTQILDMVTKIESKKADIWVEQAMVRLNWIVILAVIGGVLALILK